jgi:hypothetical protein
LMIFIRTVPILLIALMTMSLVDCSHSQSSSPISDKIPKDLFILYGLGACHAEWGRTEISIDANGLGSYEEGSGELLLEEGEKFENEIFRKEFVLNETELLDLLQEINISGFYELNDSYYNPEVQDGSCEGIAITKKNSTKSIYVSNIGGPQAYQRTAKLILDIAWNKTHPKTFEPLIQDLNSNYVGARQYAASALGELNDTRAFGPLIQTLKDESEDDFVRASAADSLGKLNDSQAIEPLIHAFRDDSSDVRFAALKALVAINAVDPLIQALKDKDSQVRQYAATALDEIKERNKRH